MTKHLNRWRARVLALVVMCGFLVAVAAGELRPALEWSSAVLVMALVVIAAWKANQPAQPVSMLLYGDGSRSAD